MQTMVSRGPEMNRLSIFIVALAAVCWLYAAPAWCEDVDDVLHLVVMGGVSPITGTEGGVGNAATVSDVAINHTYEARIRVNGKVSTTRVQASDAGQAKKLVQAQFGQSVTVLSVKRVD